TAKRGGRTMTHRGRPLVVLLVVSAMVMIACGQKHGVHLASSGGSANGALVNPDTGEVINPDTGQPVAGATAGGTTGAGGGGTSGAAAAAGRTGSAGAKGAAAATAGAAGAGDSTGVTNDSITIGIHAPVTGAAPFPATAFSKGKDVSAHFIHGKGGINGRKGKAVVEDDGYNPSQT